MTVNRRLSVYNPYQRGIDAIHLLFAAKYLREVREALEAEQPFASQTAIHALNECLKEAARIEGISAMRDARAEQYAEEEFG